MSLTRWIKSSRSCPKYVCYCPCCLNRCFDHRTEQDKQEDKTLDVSSITLFDIWSFSHLFVGIITSIPVFFIAPWIAFLITLGVEIVWEVFENSAWGVAFFKWRFVVLMIGDGNYTGDHFYNSIMDIVCNCLGFLIMYGIKLLVEGA